MMAPLFYLKESEKKKCLSKNNQKKQFLGICSNTMTISYSIKQCLKMGFGASTSESWPVY